MIKTNKYLLVLLFFISLSALNGCKKNNETLKGTWTRLGYFPGGERSSAASFVIGNYGYLCTGNDKYNRHNDVWRYDPAGDSWIELGSFPGIERTGAVAFSIGNKGYLGLGFDGVNELDDFWEYDPSTDKWTQKSSFPGLARYGAVGFGINGKAFIGCGFASDGNFKNDFYKYDPATDTWEQISYILGKNRFNSCSFVYKSRGYVVGGSNNGSAINDFSYLFSNNGQFSWERLNYLDDARSQSFDNSYTDLARESLNVFLIGDKAYVAFGRTLGKCPKTAWEYDIANDSWYKVAPFPSDGRAYAAGFSIGGAGYAVGGMVADENNGFKGLTNEVWKFVPENANE
jgi:N-acetylneuraminic acid mutarotase